MVNINVGSIPAGDKIGLRKRFPLRFLATRYLGDAKNGVPRFGYIKWVFLASLQASHNRTNTKISSNRAGASRSKGGTGDYLAVRRILNQEASG